MKSLCDLGILEETKNKNKGIKFKIKHKLENIKCIFSDDDLFNMFRVD